MKKQMIQKKSRKKKIRAFLNLNKDFIFHILKKIMTAAENTA